MLATGGDRNARAARGVALVGAVLGLPGHDPAVHRLRRRDARGMQFVELRAWIARFNVNYHLGVDGISVLFDPAQQLHHRAGGDRRLGGDRERAWRSTWPRSSILSGLMNGVFAALDGVLFYVFFEATLIPMFIIIGVWGGPNRVYAAVKFFLYTLLGSLLMLVALHLPLQRVGRQLRDPRLAQAAARRSTPQILALLRLPRSPSR